MGIGEQARGKNCCWMLGDGLRGWEGGNLQHGSLWKKTGLLWKQDTTAESQTGGGASIVASLSPHTPPADGQ